MRIATLFALLSLVSVSSFAAEDRGEQPAKRPNLKQEISAFKAACQSDVKKLCSDITPGQGKIASCLDSKEDQLSPGCAKAKTDLQAKISARMGKAEVALRKSCGADVQKFCSEVPSGGGRIMDCLSQHDTDLSSSCKTFQSKVKEKAAKFMG